MPPNRQAGIFYVYIGGILRSAVGDFTYNLGYPKREDLIGATDVDGYSESPQASMIEGEIRNTSDLSIAELRQIDGETVSIELATGKRVIIYDAWEASDGDVGAQNSNAQVIFKSRQRGREDMVA